MKRVYVVGGGFAGLSASVYLAENNFRVTLLEASPKLGGRAYSLFNNSANDIYDNGQHILMGCYEETIAFLKKINALDKVSFQESLNIHFIKCGGEICKLDSSKYFYPLNLLSGIMNYKALSLKERFKVIDFFLDLLCCTSCDLKDKTVSEWLDCKGQSENSIKSLWEILVAGTLNTDVEKASAEMFSDILKTIFLTGKKSASIVLPNVGLTQLYVDNSVEYVNQRGGKIMPGERVISIEMNDKRINKIVTPKNIYDDFDYVIFAIPAYAFHKVVLQSNQNFCIPELKYSSIINVHLWLKENPFVEKFYGLIASKIHWIFNHGNYISLTTSAADTFMGDESQKIVDNFSSELEKYFPIFRKENIVSSKIIKERRATFIPDIESIRSRKNFDLSFENMFVAGDWVNTELPSTIEGAVLSGKLAAGKVTNSLS